MIIPILLIALLAQATPKKCAKGEYLTVDGRCLHDQTGESHPAGDGCNTITCMDPACHFESVTALYCAHPDDPASVPAVAGEGAILTPTEPSITPGILSGETLHMEAPKIPTIRCVKALEGVLIERDGVIYVCSAKKPKKRGLK
jgi:hypothetical protein